MSLDMPPSTPTSPFPVPWPATAGPTYIEPALFDLGDIGRIVRPGSLPAHLVEVPHPLGVPWILGAPLRDTTADCCPAGSGHEGDCPGWPPHVVDHPDCCTCDPAICQPETTVWAGDHCEPDQSTIHTGRAAR